MTTTFDTQPARRLWPGERLKNPTGLWTVADVTATREDHRDGSTTYRCVYLLRHQDGHREEWAARDMDDFHLLPPAPQPTV